MVWNRNLISVMVITYNQERYIRQCLDGILSQKTQYRFEIVIGDDASTDKTFDIIQEYKERFPSKIRSINEKHNVGVVRNFIRTIKSCRGEFLAFCEGDDYWIDENKLESQVSFLIQNSDYGLCYTDYNVFNEDDQTTIKGYLSSINSIPIEGFHPDKMIKGDSQIMTLTTCVRKSLLDEDYLRIMNDKSLLVGDFPTWLWIGLKSKIHFYKQSTAVYRVHKNSFTNSFSKENRWKFARSHYYIRKKIINFLNYVSPEWKAIDCQIQRELMLSSLKLKYKQVYGIASFRVLKKHHSANFEDYITAFGLYCPYSTWIVRIFLSLIKRLKIAFRFLCIR